MKQFFAAYNAAASTVAKVDGINGLLAGQIGIFNTDGTKVVGGTASSVTGEYVTIAFMSKDGELFTTQPIFNKSIQVKSKAYEAATKKEAFLGFDGTTTAYDLNFPTLVEGDTASIWVKSEGVTKVTNSKDTKVFDTIVEFGDTETTIINRLVAKVNANPIVGVVASNVSAGTNYGIKFVAKDFATTFKVGAGEILINADVLECKLVNKVYTVGYTVPNALVIGNGNLSQLADYESDYFDGLGRQTERPVPGMFSQGSFIDQSMLDNDIILVESSDPSPNANTEIGKASKGVIVMSFGSAADTQQADVLSMLMTIATA